MTRNFSDTKCFAKNTKIKQGCLSWTMLLIWTASKCGFLIGIAFWFLYVRDVQLFKYVLILTKGALVFGGEKCKFFLWSKSRILVCNIFWMPFQNSPWHQATKKPRLSLVFTSFLHGAVLIVISSSARQEEVSASPPPPLTNWRLPSAKKSIE